jgi:hypothetical protein
MTLQASQSTNLLTPEAGQPDAVTFLGIEIAWQEGCWTWRTPDGDLIQKPTFSVWNPDHWHEVARRLVAGQRCAMQIAGAFGAGMIFEAPRAGSGETGAPGQSQFAKMAAIKQGRPWKQNFVAFVHPDDQAGLIDFGRLAPRFGHLAEAENRMKAYGWANHNVYPLSKAVNIDSALVREDDCSIACFWIKGHWGFEGLLDEVKKIGTTGFFGGGSLNFHSEPPCFTKKDVYAQIATKPQWQEALDFILLDDISEGVEIARSQPMLSFMGDEVTLIRYGSMSLEEIERRTGYKVVPSASVKYASSTTEYNAFNNRLIDERIARAESVIAAFESVRCPPG